MDLRAELGDRRGMSVAINNMALLELDDGNFGRARELFEQALAIKREFGEQRSIAIGLANLADVLIRTSQWEAADDVAARGGRAGGRRSAAHRHDPLQPGRGSRRTGRTGPRPPEYFRAAIAALQAGGHPHGLVEAMIGLGRACRPGRVTRTRHSASCGPRRLLPLRPGTRSGRRRPRRRLPS